TGEGAFQPAGKQGEQACEREQRSHQQERQDHAGRRQVVEAQLLSHPLPSGLGPMTMTQSGAPQDSTFQGTPSCCSCGYNISGSRWISRRMTWPGCSSSTASRVANRGSGGSRLRMSSRISSVMMPVQGNFRRWCRNGDGKALMDVNGATVMRVA